jgi:ubiquinone biosynthesis protein
MRRFRVYRWLRTAIVIAAVAVRYWWLLRRGDRATKVAWQRAHAKTGRAIYRLATGLGGAFIKVGQVLGARGDAMPAELVEPLRGLHDRVPPRKFDTLSRFVERELGRPLDDVFASIDREPLAAASLAQVHRAKLRDGSDVVIKIQYPEARRLFPIDLASLRRAVRVARWLSGMDLRPLADELAEFIALELDFSREARSTERVRADLAGDPTVVVPKLHAELCTDRVLVLDYLAGTPLSAVDKLRERGVDLRQVARRVAELYARMVFEHGFFQGDPHPGNILVLPDGRIGLLDFGLAKELPQDFAASAAQMIVAAMAGDAARAATAAQAIGFVVGPDRAPELVGLVRALMGDYTDAGKAAQLIRGGEIAIPSHFLLIARVLVILNGLSHSLVPGERVIAGAMAAALMPHVMRAKAG